MNARSLWHMSPGNVAIKEQPLPPLKKDEILIKAQYSFVSQGTESLVNSGLVPKALYQQMSVPYMAGTFDFPCTYGYSLVGEIIDGPGELIGKRGHLMHPHQDYCVVKQESIYLLEGFNSQKATLISNMETAINAMWDGDLKAGGQRRVLVLGLGSIGLLTALTIRLETAAEVCTFDLSEDRRAIATSLGLKSRVDEYDFDVVYHTTGSSEGLQMAIDLAGKESNIVELSWYGTRKVTIDLGTSFHYGRKKIIGSQVSHIPEKMEGQWDFRSRKKYASEIVRKLPELPFQEIPFEEIDGDFKKLKSKNAFTLIKY